MGFYDNIENEDAATDRGAYVRAGRYLALINRVRSGESKKHSCDYVAVDMTIIKNFGDGDPPMIVNPATGSNKDWVEDPKGHHREGEDISAQFLAKWPSAKRNYKAFIGNAVGVPEKQVTPKFCQDVEEGGLLAGEIVELNNRMIEKKDDAPFTKVVVVRPVPASEYSEQLADAIIERFFPEGFAELIAAEAE